MSREEEEEYWKKEAPKIIEKYQYRKMKFADVLKNKNDHNEIMITTKECYFINYNKYYTDLKKYFDRYGKLYPTDERLLNVYGSIK